MRKSLGIFISATMLFLGQDPRKWKVSSDAVGKLYDYASKNFKIFVVFYYGDYMFNGMGTDAIMRLIQNTFKEQCGVELPFNIMFINSLEDPYPFWDIGRQHEIDMTKSLLVAESKAGQELGDIIEIGYFNYPAEFLHYS